MGDWQSKDDLELTSEDLDTMLDDGEVALVNVPEDPLVPREAWAQPTVRNTNVGVVTETGAAAPGLAQARRVREAVGVRVTYAPPVASA